MKSVVKLYCAQHEPQITQPLTIINIVIKRYIATIIANKHPDRDGNHQYAITVATDDTEREDIAGNFANEELKSLNLSILVDVIRLPYNADGYVVPVLVLTDEELRDWLVNETFYTH